MPDFRKYEDMLSQRIEKFEDWITNFRGQTEKVSARISEHIG